MQPLISLTSCIGQELSKKEVPWTSPELGNLSHILHTSLPEKCAAHILSSPVNMFKAPHLRSLLAFLKKTICPPLPTQPDCTNNDSQKTLKIDNNFPRCLCKSCFACLYVRQGVYNVGEEKEERRALDYNWQWGNSNRVSLGRTSPSE